METGISAEDLQSGVEILSTTQPNTPNKLLHSDRLIDSVKSVDASPTKSFLLSSPATNSFSEKALQVQRTLQSSLTMSLRKEAEIKTKWQASPGEVFCKNRLPKANSETAMPISTSYFNVPGKIDFTGFDLSEEKIANDNTKRPIELPSSMLLPQSQGPNICLSNRFPSGLSPIKPCLDENTDKSSIMESSQDSKVVDEDPSTKKLLEFIQKLEKGPVTDVTLAERMNQLSFLLKNSSINSGSKSETEGIASNKQLAATQCHKPQRKDVVKELIFTNSMANKSGTQNQTQIPTKPYVAKATGQKKSESKAQPVTDQSTKPKMKSSANLNPPINHKSVHFSQNNKQDSRKTDAKASHKNRKSKTSKVSSESSNSANSIPLQPLKEPVQEKLVSKSPSKPVHDMNTVRNQLHTMLNLQKIDTLALDSSNCAEAQISGQESKDDDTFRSTDTATLLRVQPSEMFPLSPTKHNPEELTSELFSILKSGSNNQQPHSNRSSIDSSIAAENGILRDTLEKETYRRKHCEKQIQKLQKKVLEVQQELAVANSTDRKKDLMIEQLDKTLAKVVEGWKTHETNLMKTIGDLASEKEKNKEDIVKLKEFVVNLENELAKVLEELVEEKEHVLRVEENEKAIQRSYMARAEEIAQVIDQKNEQANKLERKFTEILCEKKSLEDEIEDLKLELKSRKKAFAEKESQWEEAVVDIERRQKDLLEKEKFFTEQERKRCTTIQSALSSTEQEVSRLRGLADAQRGEVESIHTQMAVMEAKQQADIQKLEAEHKITVERQVMDKLAQVHQESQANEVRIRENHKKQMLDLMSSHKREMESQCRRYEDELQKRDENMRRTLADHQMANNEKLKTKSEEMRQQMLSKMQNLLQSHYNETLQVVGNTTDVTPQRAPIPSKDVSFLNPNFAGDSFMHPTSTYRSSIVTSRETETAIPAKQESAVIKPIPTVPSTYQHKSAFSLASSVSPPSISTFQPLTSHPTSFHSIATHHPGAAEKDAQPVSVNSAAEVDDALTNLSLLSSISHGPVSSYLPPPSRQPVHYGTSFQSNLPSTTEHDSITEQLPVISGLSTNTEAAASHSMSLQNFEDLRQTQLQHYVQMLLQRSPGDPVEISTTESSPGQKNQDRKDEDKENSGIKMAVPMTMQSGSVLMQLLNQQGEASPDLIPGKQHIITSDESQSNTTDGQIPFHFDKKIPSNLTEVKRGKQNVRFAHDVIKARTHPIFKETMTSQNDTQGGNFLSPAQVGEISQILDLYSTADTPTGETRLAAEQLLRYLRNTNSANEDKSSLLTTVTSSPVKKTTKQLWKHGENLALPSGKIRSKIGSSPGKSNPVWR